MPENRHIRAQTMFIVEKNLEYFDLNLNSNYLSRELDKLDKHFNCPQMIFPVVYFL